MSLFFISCKDKNENLITFSYDPENVPTMTTYHSTMLISDSGITRYRMVADEWRVFDKAKEPYYLFPSGAFLERFTPDFEIEATIEADTAWNFIDKNLWRLKKNVHIENMEGDEFDTDEMFMDLENERVYSDEYIEIKRGETKLKGYGFESNLEMTDYRIFRPHDGLFPFSDSESSIEPSDSLMIIPADSLDFEEVQLEEVQLEEVQLNEE